MDLVVSEAKSLPAANAQAKRFASLLADTRAAVLRRGEALRTKATELAAAERQVRELKREHKGYARARSLWDAGMTVGGAASAPVIDETVKQFAPALYEKLPVEPSLGLGLLAIVGGAYFDRPSLVSIGTGMVVPHFYAPVRSAAGMGLSIARAKWAGV